MAMTPFLAITATEMRNSVALPEKTAWMSCHFSPSSAGLSNLPPYLPPGSVLILDDETPICGHDPEQITRQLMAALRNWEPVAILLDFQRPKNRESSELAAYLCAALPCPVITAETCTGSGPVFLPPAPLSTPLQEYLSPWKDRTVWLDLGCWGEVLRLTEDGCTCTPLPPWSSPEEGIEEKSLHCHYRIRVTEAAAEFTLWRTREDLYALLEEAETLGVCNAVGIYRELYSFFA